MHIHHDAIVAWAKNPNCTIWYKPKNSNHWSKVGNDAPSWLETTQYHVGLQPPQDYIEINGHKVKKPLTSLVLNQEVYITHLLHDALHFAFTYNDPSFISSYLKKGLCHATKEDAIAHAKALLSFTTP